MADDQNVVFDNTQSEGSETPQEAQTANQEGAIPAVDPNATAVVSPDESGEQIEGAEDEQEAGEVPPEEPPPQTPTGIGGFLGGRKKLIFIGIGCLILLILLIMLLIPKKKESKHVTLIWWGLWEDSRVVQGVIDDFQREHPDITIQYRKEDPTNYKDRLIARINNPAAEDRPDIFRYHNTWYPMLKDYLLPLSSDVITPDDLQKNYYPVVSNDVVHNGAIYGIPLGLDVLGLFVNTDILQAAGVQVPQTWDDFRKVATAVTVKDSTTKKIKTAGAALGTFGNVTHAPDIISLLLVENGIDLNKFTEIDKSKIGTVFDYYISYANPPNNVWDGTLDQSLIMFAKGNLAMYFGYSWDIFELQKITTKGLHYKIYPVPHLPGKSATIASYWVDGVSAKSPNQTEALLFMHYLTQKDTLQKLYTDEAKTRSFGELYPRLDLANALKQNDLTYPFVEQFPNASSTFFSSNTHDGDSGMNSANNAYLGTAIDALQGADSTSEDSVSLTLQQGVLQVLQKNGAM